MTRPSTISHPVIPPEVVPAPDIAGELKAVFARNRPAFPLELATDLSGLTDEEVAALIIAAAWIACGFPPKHGLLWPGMKG